MRLDEFASYDAVGLAELIRAGDVTPGELSQCAAEGIEKVNPTLNAILPAKTPAISQRLDLGNGPAGWRPHAAQGPVPRAGRLALRERQPIGAGLGGPDDN